jgi:hypothetical protein
VKNVKGKILSNMEHITCEYVFNVGITIDMYTYYMSQLYSSYSKLYDEFDQNNVVNNQTFMDMLVSGTLILY